MKQTRVKSRNHVIKPEINRNVSRCNTAKTPRRVILNISEPEKVAPLDLNRNFEIDRNIFTPTGGRLKLQEKFKEKEISSNIEDTDLLELNELIKRIPDPRTSPDDDVFSVTPVLDRILGTVGSWDQRVCMSMASNETILNLQEHLFPLIEVDDFLVRTIVCRILLCFTCDETLELLAPISKIFYKLSTDKNNFDFFVEESLENVLISLVQSTNNEASVYGAGTIRNISAYEPMRRKFIQTNLLEVINEIFKNEDAYTQVKDLLSEATINICADKEFRENIVKSNFVTNLAAQPNGFKSALSMVSHLPETVVDDRLQLLADCFQLVTENNEHLSLVVPYIESLVLGIEDTKDCGNIINQFILIAGENQELLEPLLKVAVKSCSNEETRVMFEKEGLIASILKNVMNDTNVLIAALNTVKQFKGDEFVNLANEYSQILGQK